MAEITIDKYLCVKCGQCIVACPARIYQRKSPNDYPSAASYAEEVCIGCAHCLAVCPVGAITVDGKTNADCVSFADGSVPRFEQIANLARLRRSIRSYSDKPMDNGTIEQMLDVVRYAPTAINGLPVKWIAVNGRKKVLELAALVSEWSKTQLPKSALLLAEWERGGDPFFRGAPCVIIAYTDETAVWPVVDATIAVETLDLCAAAKHLGSCWAGYFVRAAQSKESKGAINAWLGLKDNETAQGGLMLGHTGTVAYQRIPYRPELSLRWIC
jgi:ferredoxin